MELEPDSDSDNDILFLNLVRGTSGHCIGLEPLLRLCQRLKKYNVQVTAVQEIRWHGSGIDEYKSHTVLYSGKSGGTHEHGVAFIVDNSIRNNIIDFIPVNERICIIRLRMKFFNIAMVNIYAPTEEKEANLKDEFYQPYQPMMLK